MRIQLWSYNYDPEPTGIGPVSRVFAEGMKARGHHVDVVAAHPHYPEPRWGTRVLPYREERNGIPVLRLPLWVGRATATQRYRQELTFTLAQLAALPALGHPDVIVAVSPSFPALAAVMLNARLRRIPWVLWLQDILPDGAASTGIVGEDSAVIQAARRLERAAYASASRIVVISEGFRENLLAKGVPGERITVVYNPATRVPSGPRIERDDRELRILSMGNLGRSQGLAAVVRALESYGGTNGVSFRLVITGTGTAAGEVRAAIRTERIKMLGLVADDELERELLRADLALVSQRQGGVEFNLPSKLMTFMGYGLPVLAVVDPAGEVASLVRDAAAGWIVSLRSPEAIPRTIERLRDDPQARIEAGANSAQYAASRFSASVFVRAFDGVVSTIR